MADRIQLQSDLEAFLGSRNVYFNPPKRLMLQYPCYIYNLSGLPTKNADNESYIKAKKYQVIYITENPDDGRIENVLDYFNLIAFDRSYQSDGLHHYVYTLYY